MYDDWLTIAKRLPIGTSVRVRHLNEVRNNLLVSNHPGRWSAWCFRCNRGWCVRKTHRQPAPEKHHTYVDLPEDLQEPPPHILAARLWEYGITESMFPGDVLYSPSAGRLFFIREGAWDSRDTTGRAPAKWMHSHPHTLLGDTAECAFVVEDLLSAVKLHHAIGCACGVLCTHGTAMSKASTLALVDCTRVFMAYDGDAAGDVAFLKNARKLSPFCQVYRVNIPRGKDPKDLSLGELKRLYEEVRKYEQH